MTEQSENYVLLARQVSWAGRVLDSDLRLLHEHLTTRGKPRKYWYRSARKNLALLKALIPLIEADIDEQEKLLS